MIIDHIAVLVDNLDVSQAWYEKHCKATLIFKDHKYRRMKMNNTTIALISKKHYEYAHIGLLVEDKHNFPKDGEVVEHRDGTTGCYLKDPDGNVIEYIYYSDKIKQEILK
jgi:catechol 2,3-dioxygenase-like lactoylglutathione lyase family enzyme